MLVIKPYNRENAVAYARKYAFSQNSLFANFAGIGGNCTNFVSQSIYAGSCEMNYKPTFGWYFISLDDRSPSWTGVEYFYNFMTQNTDVGPFGRDATSDELELGDVVQLANSRSEFYHTLMITGFEGNEILVSGHTNDALDRPLSSYNYSSLRVLHINGVYFDVPLEASFASLMEGTSLESIRAILENVQSEG
jgi:hypothetical protein